MDEYKIRELLVVCSAPKERRKYSTNELDSCTLWRDFVTIPDFPLSNSLSPKSNKVVGKSRTVAALYYLTNNRGFTVRERVIEGSQ